MTFSHLLKLKVKNLLRRKAMNSEEDKKSTVKKKSSTKKSNTATHNNDDHSTQAIIALRDSLVNLQQQNEARMSAQEIKLADLYQGLEGAFSKIHQDSNFRDDQSSSSFNDLSSTIILSSEQMRKEYEEMERLQEKRQQAENQQYKHSITKTKIIAYPAIILAFAGLIHMFYTVNIMEKAMTQMSHDMGSMRQDMTVLTNNISGMRQDMNVLTHNVAPAMNGMRRMMPWSP